MLSLPVSFYVRAKNTSLPSENTLAYFRHSMCCEKTKSYTPSAPTFNIIKLFSSSLTNTPKFQPIIIFETSQVSPFKTHPSRHCLQILD
jgi:hypothetical protein